jgi:hypothetical protein
VWHGAVLVLTWKLWAYGKHASFNSVTGIDLEPAAMANFLLLVSIIVLGYIMFRQRRWAASVAGVIGLLFLMSLGWTWLNLAAVGVVFLFNLWSATRVRREINQRRVMNIPDAFYHGLLPVILGMFVMFSFAAYQSPLAEQIKKSDRLPSQSEVFFRGIVEKTIGHKIEASTPQQKQRLLNEIASQTFQEFNSFLKPYFQYAPPVLAFGLFLILWGLSFIFVWLSAAIGLALYWVLRKTGVVRIEKQMVEADVLVV